MLRLVRAARDGLGVRALAESTGMHENTIRFHLARLVDEGLVERSEQRSGMPGRPPLVFVARQGVGHEGEGNYALIAQVLSQGLTGSGGDAVEALDAAIEFGRRWGRDRGAQARAGNGEGGPGDRYTREEAVEVLVDLLEEMGFAPELAELGEEAVLRVHTCPFRLLSEEDQAVPCGVHRGIMEGLLEGLGAGPAPTRLEPFVTPHLCLARVSIPA